MGKASRRARQEAQEQQSSRRTRRGIAALVALATGAGLTYGLTTLSRNNTSDVGPLTAPSAPQDKRKILEEAYQRALNDPSQRQTFLDILRFTFTQQSCSRIVYDPGFEQNVTYNRNFARKFDIKDTEDTLRNGVLIPAAKTPLGIKQFGRVSETPLFVGDYMFDQRWSKDMSPMFSLDDLTSVIIDHEGKHAEDSCKGMTIGDKTITYRDFPGPLYPDQFFNYLKEARAYYAQLRRIDTYANITDFVYAQTLQQAEREIAGLYLYTELAVDLPELDDLQVRDLARQQIAEFADVGITYIGVRADGKSHNIKVDFYFVKKPELHRIDINTIQKQ